MAKNSGMDYALVTGATSGIGYELAKLFAKDGYNVVLIARSEERLQQVADEIAEQYGVEVYPLAKDLFRPAAALEIYEDLKIKGIDIHVLVNNAGQGEYGFFANTDLERELDIIQLNISSLISLTKLFLKDMIARNEGKILNVASLISDYPGPLLAVYGGTKAFVLSFTEALANELKETEIMITALQPGVTDTDFFFKAGEENTVAYQETELSDPADVAKDGFNALMKGKGKVVSGAKNKMQSFMSKLMPDKQLAASMRKQNEPADETPKKQSLHEASRKEREMIQSAERTYRGRDLASTREVRHVPGKP
jgi:uncharacterized protein